MTKRYPPGVICIENITIILVIFFYLFCYIIFKSTL